MTVIVDPISPRYAMEQQREWECGEWAGRARDDEWTEGAPGSTLSSSAPLRCPSSTHGRADSPASLGRDTKTPVRSPGTRYMHTVDLVDLVDLNTGRSPPPTTRGAVSERRRSAASTPLAWSRTRRPRQDVVGGVRGLDVRTWANAAAEHTKSEKGRVVGGWYAGVPTGHRIPRRTWANREERTFL